MSDRGMSQRERQALDRYITGNYGEDQFRKRGRMSKHHSQQHPAVGGNGCPYCGAVRGNPCLTTPKRAVVGWMPTETHNARVKLFMENERAFGTSFAEREHRDIEDGKMTGEHNG